MSLATTKRIVALLATIASLLSLASPVLAVNKNSATAFERAYKAAQKFEPTISRDEFTNQFNSSNYLLAAGGGTDSSTVLNNASEAELNAAVQLIMEEHSVKARMFDMRSAELSRITRPVDPRRLAELADILAPNSGRSNGANDSVNGSGSSGPAPNNGGSSRTDNGTSLGGIIACVQAAKNAHSGNPTGHGGAGDPNPMAWGDGFGGEGNDVPTSPNKAIWGAAGSPIVNGIDPCMAMDPAINGNFAGDPTNDDDVVEVNRYPYTHLLTADAFAHTTSSNVSFEVLLYKTLSFMGANSSYIVGEMQITGNLDTGAAQVFIHLNGGGSVGEQRTISNGLQFDTLGHTAQTFEDVDNLGYALENKGYEVKDHDMTNAAAEESYRRQTSANSGSGTGSAGTPTWNGSTSGQMCNDATAAFISCVTGNGSYDAWNGNPLTGEDNDECGSEGDYLYSTSNGTMGGRDHSVCNSDGPPPAEAWVRPDYVNLWDPTPNDWQNALTRVRALQTSRLTSARTSNVQAPASTQTSVRNVVATPLVTTPVKTSSKKLTAIKKPVLSRISVPAFKKPTVTKPLSKVRFGKAETGKTLTVPEISAPPSLKTPPADLNLVTPIIKKLPLLNTSFNAFRKF